MNTGKNRPSYRISPYIEPPGCLKDLLSSPCGRGTIELALFQEHRFAFFYWIKWTNKLENEVPSLVTYDWHQDLAPPYSDELEDLKNLDLADNGEVAFYTWAKLSHLNDVQIRAAILLNKIKDVYAICRQKCSRDEIQIIKDFYGNEHKIMVFHSVDEFEQHIPNIVDNKLYFDIDLDYFTLSNPLSVGCPYKKKDFTYVNKEKIIELLSPSNPTIKWIFEKLAGFTIATEPEFCGGLKKSNYFLQIIDSLYFSPSLFYSVPNSKRTEWKHLTDFIQR
jgi:hypothetical protein